MKTTYIHSIWLVVILLVASFIRVNHLGTIPNGLYQDETAIGYNALSLLESGKDEHGRFMPLYFQSFGDWKLPVYIYSTVASIAVFGATPFAVRFTSALFGIGAVCGLYLLTRELASSRHKIRAALLASGILAVTPWHLHYSRAAFEVSIALLLYLFGTYLLISWIRKRTPLALLGGTVLFIVAAYSYNLTRLFSPILYAWVLWWGLRHAPERRKKASVWTYEAAATLTVSILLALPMVVGILGSGGVSSASGTLIWSSAAVQAPHIEFRSYLLDMPSVVPKVFFNQYVATGWQYIQNIISYFSVEFFFLRGPDHGNHGIGNFGLLYPPQIVFMLVGLGVLFRKQRSVWIFLSGWAVLTILVAALTREAPHATRSFFLLVPVTIFSAFGLLECIQWSARAMVKKNYRMVLVLAAVFGITAYSIGYYFVSYYARFPTLYASAWRSADAQVAGYIDSHKSAYDIVAIDPEAGFVYTSYLFYTRYDPNRFHETAVYLPRDSEGFTHLAQFDGIIYASRAQIDRLSGVRILLLTSEQALRETDREIARFSYPKRPVVFNIGQEIVSYPVVETAYVFVAVEQ